MLLLSRRDIGRTPSFRSRAMRWLLLWCLFFPFPFARVAAEEQVIEQAKKLAQPYLDHEIVMGYPLVWCGTRKSIGLVWVSFLKATLVLPMNRHSSRSVH